MEKYLGFIKQAGFSGINIHKQKRIELPEGVLDQAETTDGNGVFSITVSATKP